MQIGISNCCFGRRCPVEDDFRIMNEIGISYTEINLRPGWFDICDTGSIKNVIGWTGKYGLKIHSVHGPSGFPGISPVYGYSGFDDWIANPDPDERNKALKTRKKCIDIASLLGAGYFIIEYECYYKWPFWPHGSVPQAEYPESFALWKQSTDELVKYASERKIKTAIENIDGFACSSIAEYVKNAGTDMIGVCFDTSHASYGDFFMNFDQLRSYMITTHISDNDGSSSNGWTDRHWMPFRGSIDWDSFIKQLIENAYTGVLMLELDRSCDITTAEMSECINRLRAAVNKYLKISNNMLWDPDAVGHL